LPYVVFKAAMTLDGKTATSSGDSKWISCAASRELVHQLRDQVDGIVVGSGTVNADDPRLTTRLTDGNGRDPVRIVFDGSLKTSPQAILYTQPSEAKTVLVTAPDHAEADLQPYRAVGVDIIQVSRNDNGLDLTAAMIALGAMNLHSLLLEGGSILGGAMLRAELVDQVMIFVAPKMIGGDGCSLLVGKGAASISDAWSLIDLRARQIDTDILIEGEVQHVHRSD
jgi:diaminohydroxyphosphoribosylaminopyrimidine deaminase/5-amino-6-(5-phosphoribosylamino)uracil reductase